VGGLFQDSAFQAGFKASLAVVVVVGAIFVLQVAWLVVQALIISIVLAACLWPWVSRVSNRTWGPRNYRLPRFATTGIIYLTALTAVVLVFWGTLMTALPEFDRISARFPEQTAFLQRYLEPFRSGDLASGAAQVAGDVAREATEAANGSPDAGGTAVGPLPIDVWALAVGLFGGLITLGLVLIFTFFLLLDGDRFASWLLFLLPKDARPRARLLGQLMRDRVSRWVVAEAVYVTVSGAVVFTGVLLIGIPSPWLYFVLGAVVAFLPGIGPAFSLVPAFIVALGLGTGWQPVAVAAYALFVQLLDNTVLVPRTFGHVMRLPAFLVILVVLLGTALMGAWGALIATPVAVAAEILVREELGRGVEVSAK
jgi:predicted PurR-regulated permease PerM